MTRSTVISILCCKTKNCVALVGAPGVGKTAIAEGLAQWIAAGKVPAELSKARVVEVDLGAMVAGTVLRGMFESRLKTVIKEAENSGGKIILFIDEMHMLIGAGDKWGSNDAANILKPALARGRIRCVGATTFDDYRKYIEKDAALERRFQKVHVEEPSTQATIAILRGIKQQYELHHSLEIQDAAIVAAAELAGRYITVGRQFPDKAIDLIDAACATAKKMMQIDSQEKEEDTVKKAIVAPNHVAQGCEPMHRNSCLYA
uniref:AAA+ ATPase domain-containing protein n=1 Tax=Aegilops tauschii subsp. strangulata TaxID=200361 RepID=A0A453E2H9_AEGTS